MVRTVLLLSHKPQDKPDKNVLIKIQSIAFLNNFRLLLDQNFQRRRQKCLLVFVCGYVFKDGSTAWKWAQFSMRSLSMPVSQLSRQCSGCASSSCCSCYNNLLWQKILFSIYFFFFFLVVGHLNICSQDKGVFRMDVCLLLCQRSLIL